MDDKQIVDLYWQRSERAIAESEAKYGAYCRSIAYGILSDSGDAEECVSDTWLGAWNAMPPHRPAVLGTFLGKLTRRISINRWAQKHTVRRGGGTIPAAIEELAGCLPAGPTPQQLLEEKELSALLSSFVMGLPLAERRVFIRRYWYLDSVESVARRFGFTKGKVKTMLHRTRKKLRRYLEQEGYDDEG